MPKGRDRFREKYGVTTEQHHVLSEVMKDETITRAQLGNNNLQAIHSLRKRGFLTYVASVTERPWDDSWRLTEAGRNLLKQW